MSIRQILLNQRKTLPILEQQRLSHIIVEKARQMPIFEESMRVAFYQATYGEVDCNSLIECAWQGNKIVLLPILDHQALKFASYQPNHPLIKNRYSIEEPIASPENVLEASDIDLVFVPLVAFDARMNRMGMGKGYYDRTFHFLKNLPLKKKPFLIGLAYEFQKIEKIESRPWDIPLDQVITERNIYTRSI